MVQLVNELLFELKSYKKFLLFGISFIILSFSSYFIFSETIINKIGEEDGLFENITTISFFCTSIIFLILFIKKRFIILLLFSFVFFIGAGEEISWGQRILNVKTPEKIEKANVQKELNFHNLKILSNQKDNSTSQLTELLYKIFWISYCFLLPILALHVNFIQKLINIVKLPVPPILLGVLFVTNWLIFKGLKVFILPEGKSAQFYDLATEVSECNTSVLFFITSLIFLFFLHQKLNYKKTVQ